MKCVITGACGFIGINLAEQLLIEGHEVVGIDNFVVGTIDELMSTVGHFKKFKFQYFDLAKRYVNEDIFEGADVIYNMAGMSGVRESVLDPDIWFYNHVMATFNALEIARKYNIKTFVTASSSACIGNVPPPIHEEIPMKPLSPYGAGQGFKELYVHAYHNAYDMNTVALRFSNVYGPHSTIKISLVAKFMRRILAQKQINIYGDGEQTRDFIYVKDLTRAVQMAGESGIGGEVFQVCTGVETSINTATNIVCREMERHGYIIPPIVHTDPALGDIKTNFASNKKITSALGWEPEMELEEGVRITANWFINSAPLKCN